MTRVLPVLLVIGLTVYAAIEAAGTASSDMRAGTKASWLVVIVLLPVLGPVLWLLAGRPKAGATSAAPATQGPARPVALGPDDDPEFLRLLEERQRRLRQQQARPEDEPPAFT
ncbi:MAG: PLDc N-terminal domain-containing protein [Actinomycetes bacterium]